MKDLAPFLLAEQGPALKPTQENRLRLQTVAVAGRLEQLDLSNHLKLLPGGKVKGFFLKKKRSKQHQIQSANCVLDSSTCGGDTHPSSLLKVDETTLRRDTKRRLSGAGHHIPAAA